MVGFAVMRSYSLGSVTVLGGNVYGLCEKAKNWNTNYWFCLLSASSLCVA